MTAKTGFYFDFGGPNAYLSYKVMSAIEERLGTKFELTGKAFAGTAALAPP